MLLLLLILQFLILLVGATAADSTPVMCAGYDGRKLVVIASMQFGGGWGRDGTLR